MREEKKEGLHVSTGAFVYLRYAHADVHDAATRGTILASWAIMMLALPSTRTRDRCWLIEEGASTHPVY
jgi:hypothetical protein